MIERERQSLWASWDTKTWPPPLMSAASTPRKWCRLSGRLTWRRIVRSTSVQTRRPGWLRIIWPTCSPWISRQQSPCSASMPQSSSSLSPATRSSSSCSSKIDGCVASRACFSSTSLVTDSLDHDWRFCVINLEHLKTVVVQSSRHIVNLALADEAVTVVCIPLVVGETLFRLWIYGDVLCKITGFMQGARLTLSHKHYLRLRMLTSILTNIIIY